MASFQKRGKTWQYTVSAKPKPIRKGGFRTKKEAQIAALEVETNLKKGIVPHLKPEPFDEYFEEWLKLYKPHIGRNTRERYLNTLETIKEHFGGKNIQEITKRSYQEFLNVYSEDKAYQTVRKLNFHIRACVKDAIDEGVIAKDFTKGAVISGAPAKRAEEKHLNYFESKRLLQELCRNLNTPSHYLLLLGLTSGMRFAEMVGLTSSDFNFKNNSITINKTWGYTNKMHEGFGPTKNEQSNRVIKMDSKTMEIFKKWLEEKPANIHDLVFFSPQSKYKVISNNAVNSVLKRMLKQLGFKTITLHGLRHTHASVLLYQNVSIYYVSERLGHGDIETTLTYYAHIVKELRERDEKNTIKIFEKIVV